MKRPGEDLEEKLSPTGAAGTRLTGFPSFHKSQFFTASNISGHTGPNGKQAPERVAFLMLMYSRFFFPFK